MGGGLAAAHTPVFTSPQSELCSTIILDSKNPGLEERQAVVVFFVHVEIITLIGDTREANRSFVNILRWAHAVFRQSWLGRQTKRFQLLLGQFHCLLFNYLEF